MVEGFVARAEAEGAVREHDERIGVRGGRVIILGIPEFHVQGAVLARVGVGLHAVLVDERGECGRHRMLAGRGDAPMFGEDQRGNERDDNERQHGDGLDDAASGLVALFLPAPHNRQPGTSQRQHAEYRPDEQQCGETVPATPHAMTEPDVASTNAANAPIRTTLLTCGWLDFVPMQ